jgi:hypothetical protein
VPEAEADHILRALEQSGCCFVPELDEVLIEQFQLAQGAEAAARCVHHICHRATGDSADQGCPEDRFYRAVLGAALGDFGARALWPARPIFREANLNAMYALPRAEVRKLWLGPYGDFVRMLDLVSVHKHYEANLRRYRQCPAQLARLATLGPEPFADTAQMLGNLLGGQLYDAYLSGRIAKRFLRSLYFRRLGKQGAARTLYFSLQRKLRRRAPRILAVKAA